MRLANSLASVKNERVGKSKAIIVLPISLFFATTAPAQGLVDFSNRNLTDPATQTVYHAPVTLPSGQGAEGPNFTAGLFLIQSDQLQLIATTSFQEGVGAGFFVPVYNVQVPGKLPGDSATFRARVWETAAGSYQNAIATGRHYGEFVTTSGSPLVEIDRLGTLPLPEGLVMPNMSGIQPLTLIPEPSAATLFAFAASLLLTTARSIHQTPKSNTRVPPLEFLKHNEPAIGPTGSQQ